MTLRTPKYVADRYGVTLNTLRSWRYRGYGPNFVRFGPKEGTVRYRQVDLDRWEKDLGASGNPKAPSPTAQGPSPEGENE